MSDDHSGLSHDLPEYVPNVLPEKPVPEETVKVALGDDYYQGAYFITVDGHLDYEVPKSQLERRKDQPNTIPPIIQAAYEGAILKMLQQLPLLRKKEDG